MSGAKPISPRVIAATRRANPRNADSPPASSAPRTARERPSIEVHIETLAVAGIAIRNPDHLGVVIQNQLENLLAENGLGDFAHAAAAGAHLEVARLRGPSIRSSSTPHADDAGEKIARSIHGGLRA